MAQQHEEDLEALLNPELDNLFGNPDPQALDNEEASASSSQSTASPEEGPPDLEDQELADSSDEEEEDEEQQCTQEKLQEMLTKELISTLVEKHNKTPKKPKGPKMGEVLTVDGKRLIRMGGVPNCTWTCLTRKSKMHPNQH